MRTLASWIAILAMGASGALMAQSPDVVGTWKLVSVSYIFSTAGSAATTASRERNDIPYGPNPKGFLMYTREGRMMAIISYDGRKPLSGDRSTSPPEERAAAFATSFSYAGRYSITGNKVTHAVEVSSVENWINTDLVRTIKFEGDRMTLILPPISVEGKVRTTELVWERLH